MNQQINVERLRKGDPLAFKELFHYYGEKIYAFAFSYLKNENDAREIVQEVLLKVWKNRETLKLNTSLQSYLFTIAFNAIKKQFLRRSKEEAYKHCIVTDLETDSNPGDFERQYQQVILKLDLFIEEMPERRRAIFIARKKEGKSLKQISDELGVSVKTVENQITEAMKYLRGRFEIEMPEGLSLFALLLSQEKN